MSFSGYVDLEVEEIVRETDSAFLVRLNESYDYQEIWLPKSQISHSSDYEQGDKDLTLSITEWIANEKGLDA